MGDISHSSHVIQQIKNRKNSFLAAFSECGVISRAAEIAGIDRGAHYRWIQDDLEYAKAFHDAEEVAAERLEEEARRRAVEGTERPVYYQGQQCGTIREYSDTLLIFLLKGAKPEKYAERIRNDLSVSTPAQQAKEGEYLTLRQLKEEQARKAKETEGAIVVESQDQ